MRFTEQFALRDLDNSAISNITSEYLFDREHGSGFNRMKIAAAKLHSDKLFIHYKTEPTYEAVAMAINLDGSQKSSREYDTIFEFQSATDHLGDLPSFLQLSDAERIAVVRGYVDRGLARVWCSCPAFFYQAHWENMASHGSSVFPFPGPRGTGVWSSRHAPGLSQPGISMCKHIGACIHTIDKDIPTITKALLDGMQQISF